MDFRVRNIINACFLLLILEKIRIREFAKRLKNIDRYDEVHYSATSFSDETLGVGVQFVQCNIEKTLIFQHVSKHLEYITHLPHTDIFHFYHVPKPVRRFFIHDSK